MEWAISVFDSANGFEKGDYLELALVLATNRLKFMERKYPAKYQEL